MIGDADLFISHLRNHAEATRFLDDHAEIVMAFTVAAELLTGARRAASHGRDPQRVLDLLADYPVLWPDSDTLDHFADVADRLRAAGTPIGQHDTWLAALARQFGSPIATADSDFDRVEGVRVVNWRASGPP